LKEWHYFNDISLMTDMKLLPHLKKFLFVNFALPLLLLHACASTQFTAGEQKNSLPLMERDLIEEVHSVAVATFFSDSNNWKGLAEETLSIPGLSVVTAGGTDLSTLGPDNRREALVKLGRSLRSDAVLNGVLITGVDRGEIIVQLISTKDSRLLFWQAADFTHKGGPIDPNAQRELLSKMFGPLLANIATREKPPAPPPVRQPVAETPRKPDIKPAEPEALPKIEKKPKSDKKQDKGRKPSPASEDISPM
jgi:hypothetical protein